MVEELEKSTMRHINLLKRKRITINQKIDITNIMIMTKISYRMNIIKFKTKRLRKIDKKIINMIKASMKIQKTTSDMALWLEIERRGRNLLSIIELQKATTLNLLLIQTLNTENLTKKVFEKRLTQIRQEYPKNFMRLHDEIKLKENKCSKMFKNLISTCKDIKIKIKQHNELNLLIEDIKTDAYFFRVFQHKCNKAKIYNK